MFLVRVSAMAGLVFCLGIGAGASAVSDDAGGFSRRVLPILSDHCFACHGPDAAERKAGLRLDQPEAGRDWAEVLRRLDADDPAERMPPPESKNPLSSGQVATLRDWIARGARYERHWAFRPIRDAPPPESAAPDHSTIDRFIIAGLRARGLELSPPISRAGLIRRATFDLTGLPPTWEQVSSFVTDPAPDAFAKVVDRLLASPEYGERWGRHWLDLARYADTHGGSAIGFVRFPFSYTYRDYVINAFNRDLPYHRFLTEQIAADQLKLEANDPAHAALGFLTVGRQFRNRHDRIDDQIDVITRGLLGLTVACARCHDHKFDPIPTADYYALHATLDASRPPTELPLVGDPPIADAYRQELERRRRLRDDMVREQGAVMRGRLRMQVGRYLRELARGTPEQDTSTTFLSYRTEDLRPVVLERWRQYLRDHDREDPVFGPWHRLAELPTDAFAARADEIVGSLLKENGDPKGFAAEHRLATKAPRWNPRVLEALAAARPASLVDVAEVYGKVFAAVERRWLTSLLEAAAEAGPDGNTVPDQDPRHRVVNSAIERQLRHHLHAPESPTSLVFADRFHLNMLNRGVRDSVSGTLGAIDNLDRGANAPPRAMVLHETREPGAAHVFLRGNPVQRGQPVEPGFLTVLASSNAAPFRVGRRRLDLARAIVAPDNPLTRRVIVNWVWQHHFGRGLVRTPDDFGTRGDPPTHPALLDHLATQLVADGWSLKQLHRRIMLSATYRQGSRENAAARRRDPENSLLWRMPPRKLEMEAMRDALLAVSGELQRTPRPGGRPFEEQDARAVPRRSIYAFVNRDVISPLATTFDGADPSACTVKRSETMVPQQTLYALNSTYIQDRAAALLKQPEIARAPTAEERVRRLYQRVYSRSPLPAELQDAAGYVGGGGGAESAWKEFTHALLAANEFYFID